MHVADAQGIVDVVDVFADALGGISQQLLAFLLTVERLYPLRHVTACHVETFQLALLAADGVDSRFVVHDVFQAELLHLVFIFLVVGEVDNGR